MYRLPLLLLLIAFCAPSVVQAQLVDSLKNKSPDFLWLKSRLNSYIDKDAIESDDIEVLIKNGLENLEKGSYEKAMEAFRQANSLVENLHLSKNVTNMRSYKNSFPVFYMAITQEAMDNSDSAIYFLDRIIATDPMFYQAFNEKGILLLLADKPDDAIPLFVRANEINPGNDVFDINMAYANYIKSNYKRAQEFAGKAIKNNTRADVAHAIMGRCYEMLDSPKAAERHYNAAIALNPELFTGYYWRGILLAYLRKYHAAISDLRKALSLDSSNVYAAYIASVCLAKLDSNAAAVTYFLKIAPAVKDIKFDDDIEYSIRELVELATILDQKKLEKNELEAGYKAFNHYCLYAGKDPERYNKIHHIMEGFTKSSILERFNFLVLYDAEWYSDIISNTESVILIHDTLPNQYMMIGNIYSQREKYKEALPYYLKGLASSKDDIHFLLTVSRCYAKLKMDEEATAHLNKAIELDKKDKDVYFQRSQLYFNSNSIEKSQEDCRTAMKIAPKDHRAFRLMGQNFMLLDNPDSAIKYFTLAIGLEGHPPECYLERAKAWKSLMKYGFALNDLDSTLRLKRTLTEAYEIKGGLNEQLKRYEIALNDYSALIYFDWNNAYYFVLRAGIYVKLKKFGKAIEDYEQAIHFSPKYRLAYRKMGIVYQMDGKNSTAAKYFKLAFPDSLNSADDYITAGLAYNAMGKYADAQSHYASATRLDSTNAQAWGNMGWSYYKMEQFDNCISSSLKAIDLDSTKLFAMYNIALSELRKGNFEKAKELYTKYRSVNEVLRKPVDEGAIESLEALITNKILVEESKYIIDNILKKPGISE